MTRACAHAWMTASLLWACAPPDAPARPQPDSGAAADGGGLTDDGDDHSDDATDGTDGTDASPGDSGWPDDGADWTPSVTLVQDGAVVAPGDRLRVETAPAGLDVPSELSFTLTNRSSDEITLTDDLGVWLSGAGWAFASPPPTRLAPEESGIFRLAFSPEPVRGASSWSATLSIPTDPPYAVELVAEVPRPLRLVLVGDGHYTLVSDDYGDTFTEAVPWDGTEEEARSVAWGDGRFFRAGRTGSGWSDPGTYAWSEDGETWTDSTFAEDFWVSSCRWGFARFACLRSAMYTWSLSGETVIHEAQTWSQMLNDQVWIGDRFVAVGRGGRRAWAADVSGFTEGDWYDDGDYYYAVAWDGARLVAAGGTNRELVSWSDDRGETWQDAVLCEQTYARLSTLAYNPDPGIWVATSGTSACGTGWTSTDGETWTALDPSHNVEVLGVVRGRFIAVTQAWGAAQAVVTSADGVTWTEVYAADEDTTLRAMAVEDR